MPLKIGIPRALLYYYYYPMWKVFFRELGAEVVLSSFSTKGLLDKGLKCAVDEVCLPVKIAYGHVLDLLDKVDMIFMPRLVSVEKHEYICPKFLGFPDMVRCLDKLPPLIDVNINLYRKKWDAHNAVTKVGRLISGNYINIYTAYLRARKIQKIYFRLLHLGLTPDDALAILEDRVKKRPAQEAKEFTVALIGHPYNIYDRHISMNMIGRLSRMGAAVVTAERLPEKTVRSYAARLPKKLFWTLGQRMIGAAFHYLERPDICGMVHVAAFGCGPDSMTGELIERYARAAGMPFLNLTLDEHTGEAGIMTRLEAFLDMVRWRNMAAVGM